MSNDPDNVVRLWGETKPAKLEEMRRLRCVPLRVWPIALDPQATPAVSIVERFLRGGSYLLVLSGNTGCGKSVAAAVAAVRTEGSLWRHASDFEKLPDEGRPSDRWIHEASGVVIIDDAGTEYDGPQLYARTKIRTLLESREAEMLPSIVTTNLTAENFRTRYGDRLASRITGDPLGWHDVDGPDLRREPLTLHQQ